MNIWSFWTTISSNKCLVFSHPALYFSESWGKSFQGINGTRSLNSLYLFGLPKLSSETQCAAQQKNTFNVLDVMHFNFSDFESGLILKQCFSNIECGASFDKKVTPISFYRKKNAPNSADFVKNCVHLS